MDTARPSRRKKTATSVPEDAPYAQDESPLPSASFSQSSSTIRPVTPESNPDIAQSVPDDHLQADFSTATSPATSPKTLARDGSRHMHRGLVNRTATASNDGEYAMRSSRESSNRPRTRTMEERTSRDRSPASLFQKNRHRIGSVHSTGQVPFQGLDDTVTSIGHPSTISPPPVASSRNNSGSRARLIKQPPRPTSPLPHSHSAQPDSWVSPVPASDAKKILKLMRSTCGRMKGMLAFRRGDTSPWALSYCYINEETGSLVYEPKNDNSYHRTLIPDLRGCRVKTAYDAESYTAYIDVNLHNSNLEVHLRPPTQEEYDSWFAALMCWQPIRPKGIQNKMAKPQQPLSSASGRPPLDSRRHSEISLLKEAPIIKVGKMIFWDTNVSFSNNTGTPKSGQPAATGSARPAAGTRVQSFGARRWRRVSCTLRENGELKLYSDTDVTLVSVVQLSQLSRCAVQRLDPTVLDSDFCIAIYPQYTSTSTSLSLLRPIFLSLDSRVQYEVWLVLLRAFTIPQLYGPKQPSISLPEDLQSPGSQSSQLAQAQNALDMFRMERSLNVRIIEARLSPPLSPKFGEGRAIHHGPRPSSGNKELQGGYYVEVLLDGETRARTMIKDASDPFWREEFDFQDLPAALSTASLLLKKRPTTPPNNGSKARDYAKDLARDAFSGNDSSGGYAGISFDQTCGKVDVYLDDMESGQEVEKWWPMVNMYGNSVGELLVRVKAEEGVILMARDYQPMSELLHRFSNGLTLQIATMIPQELKRLSECLLNIFQVSGQAGEWIMALVEEEIDGTAKETSVSRLRFSRRLGSGDAGDMTYSNAGDRELVVRDLGNNAKLEANLLFRGNTLLTKALDFHMKRLGKEYLEETLGEKLQEIADRDPECEVDPNRIGDPHEVQRNWKRLIGLTEEMWEAIATSVHRCPAELRLIFRHIRACAEDRYGDFLRTVTYSSVSGFIFLRFFCPAVLNPKLFGLLKDHPKMRARRTLTLIAKSLQGLANMSTFGAKEQWMEPMNSFLNGHRQEFKKFIDDICSISPNTSSVSPIPPSYSTPLAILQRLPPTSREGFPSLPYLIDHARNFAELVTLWLDNTGELAENLAQEEGDLAKFHNICVALNARTRDCLERAERAERPSSTLSVKWEELVEQLEHTSISPASEYPQPVPTESPPLGFESGSLRRKHRDTETSTGSGTSAPSSAIASAPMSPTSTIGTLPIQGGPMSPMSPTLPIQGATSNVTWQRDPWDFAGRERDAQRVSDTPTTSTTAGTLGSNRSLSQRATHHRVAASSPARSAASTNNTPRSSSRYAPSTEGGNASQAGSVKGSIEETSDEEDVDDDGESSMGADIASHGRHTPPGSSHGFEERMGVSEQQLLHHSVGHGSYPAPVGTPPQSDWPRPAPINGPGGMAGGNFTMPNSVYPANPHSYSSTSRVPSQQASYSTLAQAPGVQSMESSVYSDPGHSTPTSISTYHVGPVVPTQHSPGGLLDEDGSESETTALPQVARGDRNYSDVLENLSRSERESRGLRSLVFKKRTKDGRDRGEKEREREEKKQRKAEKEAAKEKERLERERGRERGGTQRGRERMGDLSGDLRADDE
ncbi:putative Ras GTPase-activating-like protein ngap [Lasiodiplodia hormozganensis]|uniref:Ras GTPase-activating-like protein ngap n=1 Tax=Lasiodiplodia hormozganensis TaxID=869390 RepID=A0AA40D2W0_9PEZI|nr:putative Ras GTPase-activating-like protein ngap [Lasiodiplodia hormozganensis]